MPSLYDACEFARTACDVWDVGYDQINRTQLYDGGSTDCSFLVLESLRQGGFDTGNAWSTRDMSDELCARGWKRIPFTWTPERGDILLADGKHTALWLGDCLAEATYNEFGGITGGQPGDQTGKETRTCNLYNLPWTCILRYEGEETEPEESEPSDIRWLQEIVGTEADNIWGQDTDKRVNAVRLASRFHGGQFPYGIAYTQKIIGTEPDGYFGKNSKACHDEIIKRIQAGFGIEQDGILGRITDGKIKQLHSSSHHTI